VLTFIKGSQFIFDIRLEKIEDLKMCKGPETVASKNEALSEPISKTKLVTKEELRSHNGPINAWCAVHGTVVDIAEFSKRHPGGDLILLAAGIDATVLFETYHPRGVSPALINKLQVRAVLTPPPERYII
jgi:cytochrome b involved in lipid metabolism